MSNIEYFKRQVKYWSKKLLLGNIIVYPNEYMWSCAMVDIYKGKKYLAYDPGSLKKVSKRRLFYIIFHELGHFKHPNWVNNFKTNFQKMRAEYTAEKQCLYWLKKYKPKLYKLQIKRTPLKIRHMLAYPENKSYYFEAFSQIPEYAEVLNHD